jgi:hypothetical protein
MQYLQFSKVEIKKACYSIHILIVLKFYILNSTCTQGNKKIIKCGRNRRMQFQGVNRVSKKRSKLVGGQMKMESLGHWRHARHDLSGAWI